MNSTKPAYDICFEMSTNRKLGVNELSACDDDDYFSESTNQSRQSAKSVSNRVKRATSEFEYDMSRAARGKCIIVNNVNFAPETEMSERAGSQKDADELAEVLRMFGFSVERYTDLTRFQLLRIFQNGNYHLPSYALNVLAFCPFHYNLWPCMLTYLSVSMATNVCTALNLKLTHSLTHPVLFSSRNARISLPISTWA